MKKATNKVMIIAVCAVLVAAIGTGVVFAVNSKNKPEQQLSGEVSSIAEISSEEITADSESEIAAESAYEDSEPEQIEEKTEPDEVTEESEETMDDADYLEVPDETTEIKINPWLKNYVPTASEPGKISDELYDEIIGKFAEHKSTDKDVVRCEHYAGMYNGYAVTMNYVLDETALCISMADKITDEVTVVYGYPNQQLYLYKNGEFIELKSAYNQGILSETDLKDIVYYIGAKKLSYNE